MENLNDGQITLTCPHCNQDVLPDIAPVSNGTTTTYKATCPNCGRYIKWVSKSIFEGAKKANGKRRKSAWSAKQLEKDHCEICGRNRENLGLNEKLESHHKLPIEHGGTDTEDNILIVCTPCHRMVHFLRRYLNDHLAHLHGGYDVRE